MDPVIQALYSIPVLGLAMEFAGYLIFVVPSISPIILQYATPIAFAALCGVMCERSGVINIGIEGIMLAAAFTGWYAGVLIGPSVAESTLPFGATPALIVAVIVALATGVLVSLLHAWLSITVRADQIISGTIINILAIGLTGYLISLISRSSPVGAGAFDRLTPPTELSSLPIVGWLFDAFLSQGPITMSLIVIVIVFQVLLFRSRWGLRTRAVGEHPKAADTVGIDVIRIRYRNVLVGGDARSVGWGLPEPGGHDLVPGSDDARSRVHRIGRDDRRPLVAGRRVRRGAACSRRRSRSAIRSRSSRPKASSARSSPHSQGSSTTSSRTS